MAPEIITGKNYNEKVDIWASGVITYMLLSGRNPFPGKNKKDVKRLIVEVPVDLNKKHFKSTDPLAKDFIQRALIKDPSNRYTAKQLLEHPWM